MKNSSSLAVLIILPIIFACAKFEQFSKPVAGTQMKADTKNVELPKDAEHSVEDAGITREAAVIVSLEKDGKMTVGDKEFTMENIVSKINEGIKKQDYAFQVLYINANKEVTYAKLAKVLNEVRKVEVEKVGFIVNPKENNDGKLGVFNVRIPAEPNEQKIVEIKPNPLTLMISRTSDGKITLNNEVKTLDELKMILTNIFKDRENNGVFREGAYEVDKTVFIKPSLDSKYEDVIKLIDTVKGVGAEPIRMQIDDLSN